jgi:hypothetical protein
LLGVHPYEGPSGGINMAKVISGKIPELKSNKCSQELKNLIYQMMNKV